MDKTLDNYAVNLHKKQEIVFYPETNPISVVDAAILYYLFFGGSGRKI